MTTFIDGSLDPARAYYLLQMQDAAQRTMADQWPRARWIKFLADGDTVLTMTWMNKACAEQFYTRCSPRRVIGHCDRMCWPDELAAHYDKTDREAIAQFGKILECVEPVQDRGTVRVLKFAMRVDTPQLRGWFVYGECPDDRAE